MLIFKASSSYSVSNPGPPFLRYLPHFWLRALLYDQWVHAQYRYKNKVNKPWKDVVLLPI